MVDTLKQDNWDIRRELTQLQREMNQLTRRATRPAGQQRARLFPSIIVLTTDEKLVVRAEVPGMKLADFDISVSGDTLTIKGARSTGERFKGGWYHRRERESGNFGRAIRLPAEVDGDRAEATYVAGVLTILLPLRKPARPKEIAVKVAEG
jgi:HSP20 family protein